MLKARLTEEERYGIIIILAVIVLLVSMLVLNYFLSGGDKAAIVEKNKEKTIILTQAKQGAAPAPQKLPPPKSVVSTVRDAIKQGNYSTVYMEINKVPKGSPEYEELRKLVAEETQKRKAPGVRKEAAVSPSAPIRYFDESTPRDRTSDAVYVYFVDVSGTLMPRFCIQVAAKRPLGITGFTIAADNRSIKINASSVKFENTGKGVAEWYDVPLDRNTYDAVQAMIKAKKVTLTIVGSRGNKSRDVTGSERKGMRNILDGYAALGGNLSYLGDIKPLTSPPKKR